ncbi:MAG: malto-oligosyltrehalose trehalohydrolase [Candidatus Omnitrophica bacterium]|nr:malto-oligosyltrehalose trehalohydrolase [Candidatus Omnitrophota bacterium]
MNIGACYLGKKKCRFRVWAPFAEDVSVKLVKRPKLKLPMKSVRDGYWEITATDVDPGDLYFYHSSAFGDKPDPASLSQPQGVHGPSQIIDHKQYSWADRKWTGIKLEQMIIYELHVGTFTAKGTFDAAIEKLDYLSSLGITAVEIMPVAQFPGQRNWGYDGVYPFAVQNSYGGVNSFKRLIDECHCRGLAVILDVVYNHLGPEGNYLNQFGPYFTDKYKTPWGWAVNFDDRYSDEVRNYFFENALYWFRDFHVDALRLDAVHAIYDFSAKHFLKELAQKTRAFSLVDRRKRLLIAESDLNDATVVRPAQLGGLGIDAQWSDDFHHAVHSVLTKEQFGYYHDFGRFEDILKALKKTFVYDGQYSDFRKRHHGNSVEDCKAEQFVISLQNHDQIGNRMNGERLASLIPFEALKAAAGLLMTAPYVPLLFMGEEYGEKSPFFYFVDHGDKNLISAVRKGRKEEFKAFLWKGEPPDPQDEQTFLESKLQWHQLSQEKQQAMLRYYQALIKVRQTSGVLKNLDKSKMDIFFDAEGKILLLRRWHQRQEILCLLNFGAKSQTCRLNIPVGTWKKMIDSTAAQWAGIGDELSSMIKRNQVVTIAPWAFVAYRLEKK